MVTHTYVTYVGILRKSTHVRGFYRIIVHTIFKFSYIFYNSTSYDFFFTFRVVDKKTRIHENYFLVAGAHTKKNNNQLY